MYGGGNTFSKHKKNDACERTVEIVSLTEQLQLARQYFMQGNFDQCIILCDEVLTGNPTYSEALSLKSSALLQEDRFEEARAVAESNFEHNLTPEATNALIGVYLEIGRMGKVLELTDYVTKTWGENYLNLYSRACALICSQRFLDGIRVNREALGRFYTKYKHRDSYLPQHIDMLVKLYDGISLAYLSLNQYKEALKEAENSLAYRENAATSLFVKGTVLLHMRKLDDAKRCFAASFRAGCKLPEVYCAFGYAHLYSGNYEFASKILKKAYEMDLYDLRIAVGMFDAYCLDGRENALQEADRLIRETSGIKVRDGTEVRLFNVTTRLPYAREFHVSEGRPSLIIVYIWNPLSNAGYGHAAIKVEHLGKYYYFSWFPSGDDYKNLPYARRAMPPLTYFSCFF